MGTSEPQSNVGQSHSVRGPTNANLDAITIIPKNFSLNSRLRLIKTNPATGRRLDSQNRDVRVSGVLALQFLAIRPDALAVMASAIPALERLLFDTDLVVAGLSIDTLSVIKPAPPATVRATLLQFLNGDRGNVQVKVGAVLSLVRLGVNQPETVEALAGSINGSRTFWSGSEW